MKTTGIDSEGKKKTALWRVGTAITAITAITLMTVAIGAATSISAEKVDKCAAKPCNSKASCCTGTQAGSSLPLQDTSIQPAEAEMKPSEGLTQGPGHGRGNGPGGQGRGGRGMSPEAHQTIHSLFDNHARFSREVKVTEEGYVSLTTSDDPAAVKMVQSHVRQMESRLKQGMMVRRWDPAFEEFVRHYDDIDIKIENVEKGIRITASGKTEEARKVARNHAGIVSRFVKNGWDEHDVSHPTVAATGKALDLNTVGDVQKVMARDEGSQPSLLAAGSDANKSESACAQCSGKCEDGAGSGKCCGKCSSASGNPEQEKDTAKKE